MQTNVITIEKEALEKVQFPTEEVLLNEHDKVNRMEALRRALWLGNTEKLKIKIWLEGKWKKYLVETTIWGLTPDRVILKRGVTLPVSRIFKVL